MIDTHKRLTMLYMLFFLSGFPALLYQLMWQRVLFAFYGVNSESVTLIVSIFMLGLGLGALLGGYCSRRWLRWTLLLFCLGELVIGVYGACSLTLFNYIGQLTLSWPSLTTASVIYALLLLPTLLMGATLPLLVNYLTQRVAAVGQHVSLLYCANTLGAALACFVGAFVLFNWLGQRGSLQLAASINCLVAIGVFMLMRKAQPVKPLTQETNSATLPYCMTLLLVAGSGFIALSYEIIWVHAYFFSSRGKADSMALTLGGFLIGTALGALSASLFCRERSKPLRVIFVCLCAAAVYGFICLPLLSWLNVTNPYYNLYPLVIPGAFLLGILLPLLCQLGIAANRNTGLRTAVVYLANIIGATAGTLLTGFIALDYFSVAQISTGLSLLCLILAAVVIWQWRPKHRLFIWLCLVLLGLGLVAGMSTCYKQFYARLLLQENYHGQQLDYLVQNKHGVITIHGGDIVSSNGGYDGRLNIDVLHDTNRIFRAYALSWFHPAPKKILLIGLSTGAWAQVIANHPQADRVTIVEINPGYLHLINNFSHLQSLLNNPKVHIIIDDGRRWLQHHPDKHFDVIVMNTIQHWRGFSSLLLSQQFMRLCQQHLMPGGIMYLNTTNSKRAQHTARTVFKHVLGFDNFVAASGQPIELNKTRLRKQLQRYAIDGKGLFTLKQSQQALDAIRKHPVTLANELEQQTHLVPIITENNMGHEWE